MRCDPNAFGERVRELRRTNGLTLLAVSERMGITTGYLSDVERGLRRPLQGAKLTQLEQVLGVTDDSLRQAALQSNGGHVTVQATTPAAVDIAVLLTRMTLDEFVARYEIKAKVS